MINIISGKKGTGKTKILVDKITETANKATGDVVCIEKSMKLTYDIPHSVRLVDAEEYGIDSYDTFYGFVTGMLACNYDIQNVFVDGILRIGGRDYDELADVISKLEAVIKDKDIEITITISADKEELPEKITAKM